MTEDGARHLYDTSRHCQSSRLHFDAIFLSFIILPRPIAGFTLSGLQVEILSRWVACDASLAIVVGSSGWASLD